MGSILTLCNQGLDFLPLGRCICIDGYPVPWMNISSRWHCILLIATLIVLLSIISALHFPFLLLKKPLSPGSPDSWRSLQAWTYQACTIMEANPFKFISFDTHTTRWLFSQRILNNTTQYRFCITPSSNRPAFDLLLLLTFIFEIPDVISFRDKFPLIMQRKVCKLTVYSVLGHVKGIGNEKRKWIQSCFGRINDYITKERISIMCSKLTPCLTSRELCVMLLLVMISLVMGLRAYGVTVASFWETHVLAS